MYDVNKLGTTNMIITILIVLVLIKRVISVPVEWSRSEVEVGRGVREVAKSMSHMTLMTIGGRRLAGTQASNHSRSPSTTDQGNVLYVSLVLLCASNVDCF